VEAGTCTRELVVEVPADTVEREAEKFTSEYARVARIPGFRPGHAPRELVRRRFREKIRGDVVQSLVPRSFSDALKDHNWAVVGKPSFEDVRLEDHQPLTYKATFEVYPEFELKEYKGLSVERDPVVATDADVEHSLDNLRERFATFEVVNDEPAKEDDYLGVSYRAEDTRNPSAEPIEVREAVVHLGGTGTAKEFTEKLQGARPGEVREFEVTYGDDHVRRSLAGKTMRYRVEVQNVKRKVLPPADDELAKSASEFNTLDELKVKLRGDLENRHKSQVESAVRRKLLEKLVEAHQFPVPEGLVEAQLDRKLQSALGQLIRQGIDPKSADFDWAKFRQELRPAAEKEVRGSLILERIGEREKIEFSEEETDRAIREIAEERHETAAALKSRLTRDDGLARIQLSLRSQKALDFVLEHAQITQTNA
jgi:trigger factor